MSRKQNENPTRYLTLVGAQKQFHPRSVANELRWKKVLQTMDYDPRVGVAAREEDLVAAGVDRPFIKYVIDNGFLTEQVIH